MNKIIYKKIHISLYISIYGFQNCLPLYQWHHTTSMSKKFNQLNILVNIISQKSYDMKCDVGFVAF